MNLHFRLRAACLCLLFLLSSLAFTVGWSSARADDSYLKRAEVRAYLDTVAKEHDLDRNRLAGLFSRLTPDQKVLDLISRPAEKTLTWKEYRPIFLTPQRIAAGVAFVEEHTELLERAEQEYGVPAEIIAAIIGVETFYGKITGTFAVLEALATLAFDYPRRAEFFRKELTEFILLAEGEDWPVASVKGSYAGAMGMPQFIASSYRQYAVDFDSDGERDLFTSPADIIGSVANYLDRHGWIESAPVAEQWLPADGISRAMSDLVTESLLPSHDAQTLRDLDFASEQLDQGTAGGQKVSVMVLNGADSEELWVGYANFYVITRYNHSRLYAMAVFQLADAIRRAAS